MKKVFVKDGNIYVREVANDSAKQTENEKHLITKIEKLEKKVSELTEELSPENKEREDIMKQLRKIKQGG